MRSLIVIFAAYISMLVFQPVVCGAYVVMQQMEECCPGSDACDPEQLPEEKQSPEGSCAANDICCPLLNCVCCFIYIPETDFQFSLSGNDHIFLLENDRINSGFLSYCWHPPEVI